MIGYGKDVLRGKNKIYLSDPSIAPAVFMRGKTILENPHLLSSCVETAIIGHLWSHCRARAAAFSYWRNKKDKEVDLVVEMEGSIIPFEVKYQSQQVKKSDIQGLVELSTAKETIVHGYVITKTPKDLGLIIDSPQNKKIMRIPASLFCYWLGKAEFVQENILI